MEMVPNLGHALRSLDSFAGLDTAALDQIAAGSHYSLLEADAELVTEGAEVTKAKPMHDPSEVRIGTGGWPETSNLCAHP